MSRRARFTSLYHDLPIKWMLTETQWASFKEFVETTLSNGASQFKIELRYPGNSSLTTWAVRILPGYQAEDLGGVWEVSAVLDLVREFAV